MYFSRTFPTVFGPALVAEPLRRPPLLIELSRGEVRAVIASLCWRAERIEPRDRAEAASLRAIATMIEEMADA